MGQKTLEVRGYTSYNRPASWPLRSASLLADAGITLLLISFAISLGWSLFGICPRPGFIPLVLSVFAAGLYWLPQKRWLGMTVGQRLWQLRRNGAQLLQCDHLNTKNVFISSLITTFALLLSVSVFQNTVFNHPIWLPATEWKIPVDAPPSPKWAVTPFFYTLGAWPTEMGGKTLFYSLLYEKGPPTRFVGHILAQANDPDIQIIIEGPKTPQDGGSQKQIRDCLLLQSPLSCILTREANLKRHVDEISAISPKKWSLKWFSVENKALFPEEQTQGIYLNSIGKTLIQDRFILVHSGGLQQTLILSRPKTPAGEEAFQKVQEIVKSLRNFGELGAGRAWIDRQLQQIQLSDLRKIEDPLILTEKLASIQTLLISRISVDPAGFDSYFHLAGTSKLLTEALKKLAEKSNPLGKYSKSDSENIHQNSHQNFQGTVAATRNLRNAFRYAEDISAASTIKDPRLKQIQDLWLETQKY